MPVQVTYPGVYIEELPSGSKTISGVATSITAFIGRAQKGPINEPMTIFGFDEFERTFGGLNTDYPLAYAVQDFYINGGGQAIIVRLFGPSAADKNNAGKNTDGGNLDGFADLVIDKVLTVKAVAQNVQDEASEAAMLPGATPDTLETAVNDYAGSLGDGYPKTTGGTIAAAIVGKKAEGLRAMIAAGQAAVDAIQDGNDFATKYGDVPEADPNITMRAAAPGNWGNAVVVSIDYDGIDDALAAQYDLTPADMFNITASYQPRGDSSIVERHNNLSFNPEAGERDAELVLKEESLLITALGSEAGTRPQALVYKAALGNDGTFLQDKDIIGNEDKKSGIYALDKADLFNLMCIPPDKRNPDSDDWETSGMVYTSALSLCVKRRAMLIMDPPMKWVSNAKQGQISKMKITDAGNYGTDGRNAAIYFPRIIKADPMLKGAPGLFPACGMIAGIMAKTDVTRGVWKAPAGVDAALIGIQNLEFRLTDNENGLLNPQGINCLRTFPVTGSVVWGARTLRGADQLSDDYKYINVRRLTLYIEESLFRGTQWAVFEPNDATLWANLTDSGNSFMASLAKQGAFYSYEVVCDKTTTTARDINLGIVNMVVAFAPVKPAEFVVIKIQQQALTE